MSGPQFLCNRAFVSNKFTNNMLVKYFVRDQVELKAFINFLAQVCNDCVLRGIFINVIKVKVYVAFPMAFSLSLNLILSSMDALALNLTDLVLTAILIREYNLAGFS